LHLVRRFVFTGFTAFSECQSFQNLIAVSAEQFVGSKNGSMRTGIDSKISTRPDSLAFHLAFGSYASVL